ncbi:hypothetical protein HMPREF2787_05915 [Corynebacterium sp. HMSC061H03]|nr:hypothetical protein HMPREF2787_05915 [Corynebacterium sp. HMSC061H03]
MHSYLSDYFKLEPMRWLEIRRFFNGFNATTGLSNSAVSKTFFEKRKALEFVAYAAITCQLQRFCHH